VLPTIQRDFVWDEERIVKLFDSLFRGYPVGIVLLRETYQPLQYRQFATDHSSDSLASYKDNITGRRIRVVLDGQQRLSSLYVALKGTYQGKGVYFDVLSGREGDDYSENKFASWFATEEEARARNASPDEETRDEADSARHWILLSEIVGRNPVEMLQLRNSISKELQLSEAEKIRLEINFHTAKDNGCDAP
jgi:hypothetical protein